MPRVFDTENQGLSYSMLTFQEDLVAGCSGAVLSDLFHFRGRENLHDERRDYYSGR